ncbi:MAG TPA: surface-adhesin E family protein [Steroidobacteraceae bacterium]|nr:surface-adhesin E family protein [Steroidobacteraceae bacterium]
MMRCEKAAATAVVAAVCVLGTSQLFGQTPEQEKSWAADRARAAAEEKANAERLARERAARRADPMAWVRTLDPMTSGGWEFRSVANDGSWAVFSSTHQLKRSGQVVTVWMRQEFAETQVAEDGPYLSAVEKAQYDCKKEQTRSLLVIYYAGNNISGSEQTEEADAKTVPWSPIVPGTREESNFLWACNQARGVVK